MRGGSSGGGPGRWKVSPRKTLSAGGTVGFRLGIDLERYKEPGMVPTAFVVEPPLLWGGAGFVSARGGGGVPGDPPKPSSPRLCL